MSLEDDLYTPEFDLDHTTARKRYYNTTYNSRHGKRRNFNASSYIKQLEDAARERERVRFTSMYTEVACTQK